MNKCKGCQVELEDAYEYQNKGLYLATSLEREFDKRKHFFLTMVNDEGEVIVE